MEKPVITLLYTANLRGSIELLPRLYTFIRQLRAEMNPIMLIDLGESCLPEVWHCQVTGGRSMLVALDAMGYTAANAAAVTAENLHKLSLSMALVTPDMAHSHAGLLLTCESTPALGGAQMAIAMSADKYSYMYRDMLHLQGVEPGQVGVANVALRGTPVLIFSEIKVMPATTAPDATIAGVVDFVLAEAQYAQKRQPGQAQGGEADQEPRQP